MVLKVQKRVFKFGSYLDVEGRSKTDTPDKEAKFPTVILVVLFHIIILKFDGDVLD